MKTIKLPLLVSLVSVFMANVSFADLVGNYTPDANTLVLLHFDQAGTTSTVTNYGTLGSNFYTANMTSGSHTAATTVTGMTGRPSYVNGPTNFGNCLAPDSSSTFGVCGWDYNNNGSFNLDSDAFPQKLLNIGNGGKTPFTLEAIVCPTNGTSSSGQIICTDSSLASRGFQFNLASGGVLTFNFVTSGGSMSGTIPTTGNNAIVSGNWYHVAFTYDGTNGTIYWTSLDGTNGAASVLATSPLTLTNAAGNVTGELSIGNIGRNVSQSPFQGYIDEVRISNVARGSGQMQFYSPKVSITLNPVSQNVDYNLPVTFSVGAASQFPLSYQWRFNSNSIAGATNTSYTIANAAAANAGYYDCVITNSIAYTNVSSVASLVVGAANFLADRYSFNTNWVDAASGFTVTPDNIGGQTATNLGAAYETNGSLVLDGSTGTYVQLPPNLFNAGNATALTVEFWATFGANPNNVDVFAFGVTNYVIGSGIVGYFDEQYSPHTASGQLVTVNNNSQTVTTTGNLDNQTVHVAVVMDAPDKILAIYTNGVLEVANTNFTVNLSSLNDQLSWIGRSLSAASPNLIGSIDELRIFKGALSSISILQSQVQGPNIPLAGGPASFLAQPSNATVPLGQPVTFSVATLGYLPITYQWFKNGSPIAGATNFSYTYIPPLGDNGATFSCQAANTIGATTYLTNSAVVNLGVFLPPTLSWLGTADGGANNTWDTSSLDWTNDLVGGGIIAFTQTNGVLFDDRSGAGTVDIEQSIIPYKINVNTAAGYMFTSSGGLGSLSGSGSIFKTGAGLLNLDVTNNMSGPVTIAGGTLQIGNNDANGSLGSSVVTNNAILSLNRGDNSLNLANTIHGTGTLSVDGSGSVTISGNSDYTGPTLLNSGVTFLTSATGLGSPISGTAVANGALLYITANINLANGITLNSSALEKGGGGLTVDTAPLTLSADSAINVDGGATLVMSNTISGGFNLTVGGSAGGTLTLATNNSFGGFILNGPVVNIGSSGALGAGTATVNGSGRFVLASGISVANSVNASTVSPGAATGLIMVNDNTNGTVTTVSGPITFGVAAASGGNFAGPTTSGYLNIVSPVSASGLTVSVRYGNVQFSGGGNYNELQIRANTTTIGADNGIYTNADLDLAGNGSTTVPTYFDLNGFNQTVLGLKDSIGPANLAFVTNSGAVQRTLTLNPGIGNSYSFNGGVVGNIALVLNSGLQTFTGMVGTNAYTGNTTVNGGTLELANASIATNSTVTVANGAMLQLDFSTTNQVAALVLGGVAQAPGVYNNLTSPSYIAGGGSLLVQTSGPGIFTVSPSISGITLTGGNVSFNGTGGQAGDAYYLLAGTNLTKPFSQWRTVATNVLSASGGFTFTGTNAVSSGSPQQFYILSNTNYNP